MKLMIFTMFFSGGLIPLFFVIRNTGLYNTIWVSSIPYAVSAYNMIIMKTFFESTPESLEEAAIIDGANDFTVFSRIIMPLSKPVVAVMILYYGVGQWNSWFPAAMFTRDRKIYPLQMILREILIENQGAECGFPDCRRGRHLQQRACEILHHHCLHHPDSHYLPVPAEIF